jgi:hypothetical protein
MHVWVHGSVVLACVGAWQCRACMRGHCRERGRVRRVYARAGHCYVRVLAVCMGARVATTREMPVFTKLR